MSVHFISFHAALFTSYICIPFYSILFLPLNSASRLRQMNPQLGVSSMAAFTAVHPSQQQQNEIHAEMTTTCSPTNKSTPESLRSGLKGLVMNPFVKELEMKNQDLLPLNLSSSSSPSDGENKMSPLVLSHHHLLSSSLPSYPPALMPFLPLHWLLLHQRHPFNNNTL